MSSCGEQRHEQRKHVLPPVIPAGWVHSAYNHSLDWCDGIQSGPHKERLSHGFTTDILSSNSARGSRHRAATVRGTTGSGWYRSAPLLAGRSRPLLEGAVLLGCMHTPGGMRATGWQVSAAPRGCRPRTWRIAGARAGTPCPLTPTASHQSPCAGSREGARGVSHFSGVHQGLIRGS